MLPNFRLEVPRICDIGGNSPVGFNVFPGDKLPYGITFEITKESIDEWLRQTQGDRKSISPFIVICISYGSFNDHYRHHTPFIFWLQKRVGASGIFLDELPISVSILKMEIFPFGAPAD